ncbi:MAG: glucose-6-phosphate isomerase [Alphaproteobacteria bacterium]
MKFTYQYFSQDISGFLTNQPSNKNLLEEKFLPQNFSKLKDIISHIDNILSHKPNTTSIIDENVAKKLYALLTLPTQQDDILDFEKITNKLLKQNISEVIILGTGGSSLGSQALYEMASQISKTKPNGQAYPRLDIFINFDPIDFYNKTKHINWQKTALVAISKSGDTLETILQTLYILPLMEKSLGRENIKNHFWVVSEKKSSPLNNLADNYNAQKLIHDPYLSGRYSVLSVVGMLPAAMAGLSVKNIRKGASDMLRHCLSYDLEKNPAAQSALAIFGLEEVKKKSAVVMLSYADRLSTLCRWFRQLWAESLGKNGKGSTPIFATGPVDQHSQLELWLGGPMDKIYTILTTAEKIQLASPNEKLLALHDKLSHYQGINLEDMMDACASGINDVFLEFHLPVRTICLSHLNEESIGALLMHFMMETLFVGFLRGGFDPFGQPRVEDGKQKIRQQLERIRQSKL